MSKHKTLPGSFKAVGLPVLFLCLSWPGCHINLLTQSVGKWTEVESLTWGPRSLFGGWNTWMKASTKRRYSWGCRGIDPLVLVACRPSELLCMLKYCGCLRAPTFVATLWVFKYWKGLEGCLWSSSPNPKDLRVPLTFGNGWRSFNVSFNSGSTRKREGVWYLLAQLGISSLPQVAQLKEWKMEVMSGGDANKVGQG